MFKAVKISRQCAVVLVSTVLASMTIASTVIAAAAASAGTTSLGESPATGDTVDVIETAAEPLLDPTRPLDYESAKREPPPLTLNSILIAEGRRIAVINGRQATEREKIGDIRVLRILPNRVIVERNGRQIKLKLHSSLTRDNAS